MTTQATKGTGKKHSPKHPGPGSATPPAGAPGHTAGSSDPVFSQPVPSPDPTSFKDPVTDQKLKEVNNVEPIPQPRGGGAESILTLEEVLGTAGAARIAAIRAAGQIVLHSVGDTGSARSADAIAGGGQDGS